MIGDASSDIRSTDKQTLKWIAEDVPGHLRGASAEALEQLASELSGEADDCAKDLLELSSLLKRYAALLDEADAMTAKLIQEK